MDSLKHTFEDLENVIIQEQIYPQCKEELTKIKSSIDYLIKIIDLVNKKNIDLYRLKTSANVDQYNKKKTKGFRRLKESEFNLLKTYFIKLDIE